MPDFGIKMVSESCHWMSDQKEKYSKLFNEIIKKFVPDEVEVYFYIGRGAIYNEVINYSEKVDADLIILSPIRPQLKDYMLRPNA